MPKINQKEYDLLKQLDDKWKWIARDFDTFLWVYETKPRRFVHSFGLGSPETDCQFIYGDRFHFVRREDEEPYNIQELIEEYEIDLHIKKSIELGEQAIRNHARMQIKEESEETEVKKDIEWAKKEIKELMTEESQNYPHDEMVEKEIVLGILNQLDEPEVLSQEPLGNAEELEDALEQLLDEEYHTPFNDVYQDVMNKIDKHLLVPKQEDINKEKQKAYVKGFEAGEKQTVEFYEEHESKDFNKKVNQLIKAIENPKRIKLKDVIERMDALSEKNRNDWIERINERYEVAEEQKYHVTDENDTLLCKSNGVVMTVGKLWAIGNEHEAEYDLTEQEIKDYDERFWPFAVKVKGEEE